MLRSRSEVLNAFQNYKRRVEKKTGHCIKKLPIMRKSTNPRNLRIFFSRKELEDN